MKLLLDSHTLLWAVDDPSQIGPLAMTALSQPANDRLLSAATIWELAIKVGQGKLRLSMPYRAWMKKAINDLRLAILPITVEFSERQ